MLVVVASDGTVRVISFNFFESQIDPVFFPNLDVVGDVANSAWRITEQLAGKRPAAWDHSPFDALRPKIAAPELAAKQVLLFCENLLPSIHEM
jgi:hypothetical protein